MPIDHKIFRMLALRLRQATAGVLLIGILLSVLGFCALVQVRKNFVEDEKLRP